MGVVLCGCGKTFNDGEIPCPHQFNLIADVDLDEVSDAMVLALNEADDGYVKMQVTMMAGGKVTYRCPHCHGLLVFWDGLDRAPKYYPLGNWGKSDETD